MEEQTRNGESYTIIIDIYNETLRHSTALDNPTKRVRPSEITLVPIS
jgi:hypothetical protein